MMCVCVCVCLLSMLIQCCSDDDDDDDKRLTTMNDNEVTKTRSQRRRQSYLSSNRKPLLSQLPHPIGIIARTSPILRRHIAIPLIRALLAVSILQMTLQVIRPRERRRLTSANPALIQTVLGFLMHGLLMALLVLLALEAFLLAGLFVDAARVGAGEFVLGDDDVAVDAGFAVGVVGAAWFGFLGVGAADAFAFVGAAGEAVVLVVRAADGGGGHQGGPFGVVEIVGLFRLRGHDGRGHEGAQGGGVIGGGVVVLLQRAADGCAGLVFGDG